MSLKAYLGQDDVVAAHVAEKVGISKSHLSLIANGLRWPSWPVAKQIERATRGKVKAETLMRSSRINRPRPSKETAA